MRFVLRGREPRWLAPAAVGVAVLLTLLLTAGPIRLAGAAPVAAFERYVVTPLTTANGLAEVLLGRDAEDRGDLLDLLGAAHARDIVYNDVDAKHLFWDRANYRLKVIDWGNACYGDPLYDVAWLGWWFVKEGEPEAATRLRRRHGNAPHFAERIACYECHLGLDDLRFYAKTGRREQYEWTRDRLLALVAGDAGQA